MISITPNELGGTTHYHLRCNSRDTLVFTETNEIVVVKHPAVGETYLTNDMLVATLDGEPMPCLFACEETGVMLVPNPKHFQLPPVPKKGKVELSIAERYEVIRVEDILGVNS